MCEKSTEPQYSVNIKKHATAVTNLIEGGFTGTVDLIVKLISYLIIKIAEALVEISFRAVPIFCPIPNAITVYNLMLTVGYGYLGAGAAAGTLELISFFLIDQSLYLWDGYNDDPKHYKVPFYAMLGAVSVVTVIIIGLVYTLESGNKGAWFLAFFPILSLMVFVGLGVKRWRERREATPVESIPINPNQSQSILINPVDRGLQLQMLELYEADPSVSIAKVAVAINSNRTQVQRALQDLQAKGVVDIQKLNKGQLVVLNGNAESFRAE